MKISSYQSHSNICLMNGNKLVFGKGESVGIVHIDTGQLEYQYILDETINNRGISCIAGDKTESIFAIGDTFQSRILLFAFPSTRCISQLKSSSTLFVLQSTLIEQLQKFLLLDPATSGFYQQLQFWQSDHLIALKFHSNNFIEIWNWRNNILLHVQETNYFAEQQLIL